jgi:hypothetical protein
MTRRVASNNPFLYVEAVWPNGRTLTDLPRRRASKQAPARIPPRPAWRP